MSVSSLKPEMYKQIQDHLSDEGVFLMGDATVTGFPIRYASPGFEQTYGYCADEIKGKKCGDLIGGPFILAHIESLSSVATSAGVPLKTAEARVRFLRAKAGEACNIMMMYSGTRVGCCLLLNRKKNGTIFVCECIVMNMKHPSVQWSYCVGFQRDVTAEVSVRTLVAAAASEDAYTKLMESRTPQLERRREVLLGPGSENVVRFLHEKAMDIFSGDIWRSVRNELIGTAHSTAHGSAFGGQEAGASATSAPAPAPNVAATAAPPPPMVASAAAVGATPARKPTPLNLTSPQGSAASSGPAGAPISHTPPGIHATAVAPKAAAVPGQQPGHRQLVVARPQPLGNEACGTVAVPQPVQHQQQQHLHQTQLAVPQAGQPHASQPQAIQPFARRPPPHYHMCVPHAEQGGLPWDLLETNSVMEFLNDCGLRAHAEKLLVCGFDDMETLSEIEDGDFKDLGIPRGHALKLKRSLRLYQCLQICATRKSLDDRRQAAETAAAAERAALATAALPPVPPALADGATAGSAFVGGAAAAATVEHGGHGHNLQAGLPLDGGLGSVPALEAGRKAPQPRQDFASGNSAKAISMDVTSAVEESWQRVQEFGTERFGVFLFEELFDIDKSARELFPPEVCEKYWDWDAEAAGTREAPYAPRLHGKVVSLIGSAVIGLTDAQQLVPNLVRLGARHANYGVTPEQLNRLCEALIRCLRRCLGDACTPDVEMAWTVVYNFISASMIAGLRAPKELAAEPAQGEQPAIAHGGDDSKAALAIRHGAAPPRGATLLQQLHVGPTAAR